MMRDQAQLILSSLTEGQRAQVLYPFEEFRQGNWSYFPAPKSSGSFIRHAGLKLGDVSAQVESQILKLVELGVSPKGFNHIAAARMADSDPDVPRKFAHRMVFNYGKENYYIAFFGDPLERRWIWRFEGHHVSINLMIDGDEIVSAKPLSLGSYPIDYKVNGESINAHGELILKVERLMQSLTPDQLAMATQAMKSVPGDLMYTPTVDGESRAPKGEIPKGLSVPGMTEQQRALLIDVAMDYLNNLSGEARQTTVKKVLDAGLENIEFVFAGDPQLKELFYWRLQGPSFIFEFGCGDESRNHYHTAWMDRDSGSITER